MDITILFKGLGATKTVLEFLEIIDSLDAKIERLIHSELEAGLKALGQVEKSIREQESLLREARSRFNKSVCLEKGFRLSIAYLGLAVCHHLLKDFENRDDSLEAILSINPLTSYTLVKSHLKEISNIGQKSSLDFIDLATITVSFPIWLASRVARRILHGTSKKETLDDYLNKVADESIALSSEASSLSKLQKEISVFIDKPIYWRKNIASVVL